MIRLLLRSTEQHIVLLLVPPMMRQRSADMNAELLLSRLQERS